MLPAAQRATVRQIVDALEQPQLLNTVVVSTRDDRAVVVRLGSHDLAWVIDVRGRLVEAQT